MMLKSVILFSFCILLYVECQPTRRTVPQKEDHNRVVRSPQYAQTAMKAGVEMANQSIGAISTGVDIFAQATQQAVNSGTSIAAGVLQKLSGML